MVLLIASQSRYVLLLPGINEPFYVLGCLKRAPQVVSESRFSRDIALHGRPCSLNSLSFKEYLLYDVTKIVLTSQISSLLFNICGDRSVHVLWTLHAWYTQLDEFLQNVAQSMKEWGKRIFKSHPKGAKFDPYTFRSPNPLYNHFTFLILSSYRKRSTLIYTHCYFLSIYF